VGDSFVPQSIDIAPEGHDLVNAGRIYTPFLAEGTAMKPATSGGANWPPSSYDPESNLYYVCAQDGIGFFRGGESYSDPPEAGELYVGGQFGGVDFPTFGILAALDMTTNTTVWSQRWRDTCYSGSVVTKGGLLFVGRNDGRLTALDSENGRELWEFQLGAGVNAPVSVFEHEGEQYVVAYAAGNLFAGSPRGDRVWLFSLNGALEPAAIPGQLRSTAAATVEAQGEEAQLEIGRGIYAESCSFCHGPEGEGGHNGIELVAPLDRDLVVRTVHDGGNRMPPFAGSLSPEEINAVAAYVSQWRDRK